MTPTNGYHMAEMPRSTRYYERGNLVLFHFIFFSFREGEGRTGQEGEGERLFLQRNQAPHISLCMWLAY